MKQYGFKPKQRTTDRKFFGRTVFVVLETKAHDHFLGELCEEVGCSRQMYEAGTGRARVKENRHEVYACND